MHQLGDRARADLADIRDLVADRVESGLDLFINRPIAADHHGKRRVAGAGNAAADGRIEHRDALILEDAVDPPHHGRRIGRKIGVDAAAFDPFQDAIFAERHRLDFLRSRQRSHHQFALRGDGGGRVRPLRAFFQVRVGHRAPHIVDDEVMALFDHVERHRAAHIAQADKSNSHD